MDQNNQPIVNSTQPMTPPPVMETPHKKSGPMIAGLAIILIIIIGALYMFAARSQAPVIPTEEETTLAKTGSKFIQIKPPKIHKSIPAATSPKKAKEANRFM